MIYDLLTDHHKVGSRRDVCIVGAGAAGIALAVELAHRGRTVTLLEAGGRLVEESAQSSYQGHAVQLPHRGLHGGRVRALGGTTNLWGGQILELDEIDFEQRPWIRGSQWPFAKSELTRHYARALEVEGVASSIVEDDLVWKALNVKPPKFESLVTYLSRWCPEPNFARLHQEVLESEAIEVWLHASACELMLSDDEAKGVRCSAETHLEHTFTANQYVFCLGAIESSRFFLQPRQGSLPWNLSNRLGRYFQDHVDSDAAAIEMIRPKEFHADFDAIFLAGHKYNPKVKLSSEIEREKMTLRAGATVYSPTGTDETLTKMKAIAKKWMRGHVGAVSSEEALLLARNVPSFLRHSFRYAMKHRAYHPANAPMRMRVHCEQEPCGESAIRLAPDRDQFGLLRTSLSWHVSDLELHTMRTFVEYASRALAPIARLIPDPDLGSDAFRAKCQDSYHHMGGMRMDESPRRGVVSPELQLHGTRNVFVCSSAVFPSSGFSNPTHTLIALAMRLAEHLSR